ncbi:MAG: PAS domain S-box/diguanylate cyclase (GGDEF) domain-containing protein [Erysipelotrichaceae bacterium]|nr:MAG: PAS domain S-box/diguanylate cyclase (GGDEF) domain-containing protein [Erysipelotrichaceae bacterium]
MPQRILDQLQKMHRLSEISEQFLQLNPDDEIDYQWITDNLLELSEAKYAGFNLYDSKGEYFSTKAMSGDLKAIAKTFQLIGFDVTQKKRNHDLIRAAKIADTTTTRFKSITEYAGPILPKMICDTIQNLFKISEIIVVKIMVNQIMIGDFFLFIEKGDEYLSESIVEIYSRQVGMIVSRQQTQQSLIESETNFRALFDKGPIGIAYHKMIYDDEGKAINYLCIGTYGKVAKEGIQIRFQQYLQANGRWYDCVAYQYKPDHFVSAFFEITEKKEMERSLEISEATHKEIISSISDAILIMDHNRLVKYQSVNSERIFGWAQGDLMGKGYYNYIHPEDISIIRKQFYDLIQEGVKQTNFECRVKDKSGFFRTVEIYAVNLIDNPNINGILVTLHDISDRIIAETALKQSEEKYRLITENVSDVIAVINLDTRKTTFVSPSILHQRGYTVEEVMQQSLKDAFAPESMDETRALFKKAQEFKKNPVDHQVHILEVQQTHKDGYLIWVELSIKFQINKDQEVEALIVSRNIDEWKIAEVQRVYLSFHDHLTGLYNRRFFEAELQRLDVSRNYPLAIIMGDVNGLKLINDSFGHEMGDQLLIKTAEVFNAQLREDEISARLGGDEFAILLPKTNLDVAKRITKRLTEALTQEKVANIAISISFGICVKDNPNEPISEVLKKAEDNMYRTKLYESRSSRSTTIDVILNALFEKSHREQMHSSRVSLYCEKLALALGYTPEHVNQIKTAGLVHDIGKIGIDERILNKVERLDNEEWLSIRKHPEAGWRILNSVNEFSELSEFILTHHEHYDGSGYPRGLKGEAIPIEARIIAIADAYDAMTSKRSYREALSKAAAQKELIKFSGTQFDPKLVIVFIDKIINSH